MIKPDVHHNLPAFEGMMALTTLCVHPQINNKIAELGAWGYAFENLKMSGQQGETTAANMLRTSVELMANLCGTNLIIEKAKKGGCQSETRLMW